MTDISVLVVAKNDTEHLFDTINSVVPWTKEVLIIDIGIPKEVLTKLKKTKVIIIPNKGEVTYADQIRNKITSYASSSYVFFLDPDEILPKDLQEYIQENYQKYDALSFPRKNIIFGKWIQHARWWPDHQLRLYKKKVGTWEPEIHSKPAINGTTHTIEPQEKLAIVHYNYKNLDHYIEKMARYAKAEANDYITQSRKLTISDAFSKGVQEFISRFFAGDGYKDGMHGFILSFLQSIYYPLVYFYYWEQKKYCKVGEDEIATSVQSYYKELFLQSAYWAPIKGMKSLLSHIQYFIISRLTK